MRIEVEDPKAVVEEAFWLAWQACGGTTGMGFLRDRGPSTTKEQVIANVSNAGDYFGGIPQEDGTMYGDYVFGRMMKLRLKFDESGVVFSDEMPRWDYQAWCGKYKTYEALVRAAIESITEQTEKVK